MTVVYSAVLLSVLGLAAGIFLAYSAEIFKVKEDPRLKLIIEVLPGLNCGACGYPGCEGYAKAILKGDEPNKCLPGKNSGVEQKIREILKNSG